MDDHRLRREGEISEAMVAVETGVDQEPNGQRGRFAHLADDLGRQSAIAQRLDHQHPESPTAKPALVAVWSVVSTSLAMTAYTPRRVGAGASGRRRVRKACSSGGAWSFSPGKAERLIDLVRPGRRRTRRRPRTSAGPAAQRRRRRLSPPPASSPSPTGISSRRVHGVPPRRVVKVSPGRRTAVSTPREGQGGRRWKHFAHTPGPWIHAAPIGLRRVPGGGKPRRVTPSGKPTGVAAVAVPLGPPRTAPPRPSPHALRLASVWRALAWAGAAACVPCLGGRPSGCAAGPVRAGLCRRPR